MKTLFQASPADFAKYIALSIVLFLAMPVMTSHAQELQYSWRVSSPFSGTTRDSQWQAQFDLYSWPGTTSVPAALVDLLTERTIKEQTSTQTYYVYEAPKVEIGFTPWEYRMYINGYSSIGPDEQAAFDDVWQRVLQNTTFQGCNPAQVTNTTAWEPYSYWAGTTNLVVQERKFITVRYESWSSCTVSTGQWEQRRVRNVSCPQYYEANTTFVKCLVPQTATIVGIASYCSASEGNPCDAATGGKSESKTDYQNNTLSFTRHYSSLAGVREPRLGNNWRHNHSRRIMFVWGSPNSLVNENGHQELLVGAGSGVWRTYRSGKKIYQSSPHWIVEDSSGNKEYYSYTAVSSLYPNYGRLVKIVNTQGQEITYDYDGSERIEAITDHFGRSLSFTYDSAGNIATMTDPAGGVYTYQYDSNNNLEYVIYPDITPGSGTDNPRIRYHYEETSFPNYLTGITDENGQRYATFDYDVKGRVILSEHTGGERTELAYNTNGTTTVTEKINATTNAVRTYTFGTINGERRVTSVTGDVCSSCGTTSKSKTYDTNGNSDLVTDWNNVVTDYNYNNLGQETQRIEAKNTAQQRTITTAWHSSLPRPTLITETGRTTAFTYDSTGNKLTETVTDTATSTARTTTWTYNSNGQVETIDGPRTDVTDVTEYEYNTDGTLLRITNALDHETEFTSYDDHGNPLTMVDANGVTTAMTYDPRQRLLTRTVAHGTSAAATTTFEYWPAGQLKKIIQADGSYLLYTYDTAQRLIQIEDNLGNYIVYTLDNAGNRTEEGVYDPGDVLVKTQTSVFNDLNRLIETVGAASQSTEYGYDSNGNQTSVIDPNNNTTTNTFDNLNRLIKIVDPQNGATNPTEYTYDARDNLTSVEDPRGLVTQYQYNGFNEVTQLTSPDTGVTSYTYDPAGNKSSQTDAKSVTINYSYDALNRLTLANAPGTADDISYTYDSCTNGVGRLCSVTRDNVTLSYTYDVYGNIANVEQEIGTVSVDMDYVYNDELHLESVTYPSGVEVQYAYDSAGRLSSITLDEGLTSTTLIDTITYQPLGPIKSYEQDNGITVSLDYDLDARIENITAGTVLDRDYVYDPASNIEQIDDAITNALDRTYSYDLINRLSLEENLAGNTTLFDYAYDAVGNRTFYDDTVTSQSLTYSGTSNRLTAIASQFVTTDNNGNITSIHGMTLAYDAHNRLSSATVSSITTNYAFNGLGERVTKQTGSNTRHYFYGAQQQLLAEYDATGAVEREYIYLDGQPVVMLDHSGSGIDIYWIHNDHLGRPLALTDEAGDLVWRLTQTDAFSNATTIDEDPDNNSTNLTFNLRFPGQIYDTETGLHYNYFRDYDPAIGRYIESDPIGLEGGLNTYGYVLMNPVTNIDPDGRAVQIAYGILHAGAAALRICHKIPACKKAVDKAIKECKDVKCEVKREGPNHEFEGSGWCEHYRITCYKKGEKSERKKNNLFETQWKIPGGKCYRMKHGKGGLYEQ